MHSAYYSIYNAKGKQIHILVSGSGSHIATHLVLAVVLLLLLVGATSYKKALRLHRFKSNPDKIWQEYSSNEYTRTYRL